MSTAKKTIAKKTTARKTSTAKPATAKIARKVGGTKAAPKATVAREPTAKKVAGMSTVARRAVTKKPESSPASAEIFARLRATLAAHAKGLIIKTDTADSFYVVSPRPYKGKELFFGAVRAGKAYVSYHLFPIYMNPRLLAGMTVALAGRMQGKTCFNFKVADEDLFAQLGELTARGRGDFAAQGLI